MSSSLDVLAAVYATQDQAETTMDLLQKMHRASNITLADLAMVTKDSEGKVHIGETREVTAGKGARRGAIITGIFGLIYPPSLIVSVLVGGATGGLWGRLRDTGIKTGHMHEIAEEVQPGNAAVIALAEPRWAETIERALRNSDGHIIHHGFSAEETDQLERAATEEVAETA